MKNNRLKTIVLVGASVAAFVVSSTTKKCIKAFNKGKRKALLFFHVSTKKSLFSCKLSFTSIFKLINRDTDPFLHSSKISKKFFSFFIKK